MSKYLSIDDGEFSFEGRSGPIRLMDTCAEIRLKNLEYLIQQYGSIANLNMALGLSRTDATISQIRNKTKHSQTGKLRVMGEETARKIEESLNLERGWMDHPRTSSSHPDEAFVLEQFRLADEAHKALFLSVAKTVQAAQATSASSGAIDKPDRTFLSRTGT